MKSGTNEQLPNHGKKKGYLSVSAIAANDSFFNISDISEDCVEVSKDENSTLNLVEIQEPTFQKQRPFDNIPFTPRHYKSKPLSDVCQHSSLVLDYIFEITCVIPDEFLYTLPPVEVFSEDRFVIGDEVIDGLTYADIAKHLSSLRLEHIQRIVRPLVQKLILHPRNLNIFNKPVDAEALGLTDYFKKVSNPMDLGTVKSRLQRGFYNCISASIEDIFLVFKNALSYNPESHYIYQIAKQMKNDLESEILLLDEKCSKEEEKKASHCCALCQGATCPLCGEKCLKYDPPVLICHGSCSQRIKRQSLYYISPSGTMLWCQKCYSSLPSQIHENLEMPPIMKKNLLRRRFEEEVAEPWVNCDTCGHWVHQICALFTNTFEDFGENVKFECGLCKLEGAGEKFRGTTDISERKQPHVHFDAAVPLLPLAPMPKKRGRKPKGMKNLHLKLSNFNKNSKKTNQTSLSTPKAANNSYNSLVTSSSLTVFDSCVSTSSAKTSTASLDTCAEMFLQQDKQQSILFQDTFDFPKDSSNKFPQPNYPECYDIDSSETEDPPRILLLPPVPITLIDQDNPIPIFDFGSDSTLAEELHSDTDISSCTEDPRCSHHIKVTPHVDADADPTLLVDDSSMSVPFVLESSEECHTVSDDRISERSSKRLTDEDEDDQLQDDVVTMDVEEGMEEQIKNSSIWKASSLPRSKLSNFIEAMVFAQLENSGFEDTIDSLTIRMVSNTERVMEAPFYIASNLMTATGNCVPRYIPYKQKCILLFQNIDGIDVCLFSLYVQEFDEGCLPPNQSSVYISYLDSVDYFRPLEARTLVYHEIMVAYLKYVQMRGFKQCHIWACPPQRGDNFIFWCHPQHQRTPSRDRLNAWYSSMLKRCQQLGFLSQVDSLFETYFSAFRRKDDTIPQRDKAGTTKAVPVSDPAYNKYTHQVISRIPPDQSSEPLKHVVPEKLLTKFGKYLPISPPIFEGDFWILECARIYRLMSTKGIGINGRDIALNQRRAKELIKHLMSKPGAAPFNEPVDVVRLNIPSYLEIITSPMDLGSVRDKLKNQGYENLLETVNDIRLTFDNAKTFNPPSTFVHEVALKLSSDFETMMREFVVDTSGPYAEFQDVNEMLSTYVLVDHTQPSSSSSDNLLFSPFPSAFSVMSTTTNAQSLTSAPQTTANGSNDNNENSREKRKKLQKNLFTFENIDSRYTGTTTNVTFESPLPNCPLSCASTEVPFQGAAVPFFSPDYGLADSFEQQPQGGGGGGICRVNSDAVSDFSCTPLCNSTSNSVRMGRAYRADSVTSMISHASASAGDTGMDYSDWSGRPNAYIPSCSYSGARAEISQEAVSYDAPQLGIRGVMTLMSELSKTVHRMKDDLFVIKFASPDSSSKSVFKKSKIDEDDDSSSMVCSTTSDAGAADLDIPCSMIIEEDGSTVMVESDDIQGKDVDETSCQEEKASIVNILTDNKLAHNENVGVNDSVQCLPESVLVVENPLEHASVIKIDALNTSLSITCKASQPQIESTKNKNKKGKNRGNYRKGVRGRCSTKSSGSDNELTAEEQSGNSDLGALDIPRKCLDMLMDICADTSDPDEIIQSPFVDSRHTFLEMCQFRHYQFDSLRRAKHSSLMILYHLHNPFARITRPICVICDEAITQIRWHCECCPNYEVCAECFKEHEVSIALTMETGETMVAPRMIHEHPLTPYRVTIT